MATTDIQQSSNSRLPSTIITPTVAGEKLSIAMLTKQNVNIDQYTTLNEVLGFQAAASIGGKNGKDFAISYFGVGISGAQVSGVNVINLPKMVVNQHQPTDNAMFYQIPLIIRELANDLNDQDRARYRGRVILTINNVKYVAYYLRSFDFTNFVPTTRLIKYDPATATETPTVFVPQEDDIHPTPLKVSTDGTVPVSNNYISATGKLDMSMTPADLEELQNVCSIMFNDASLAALNEYCVVAGIDTKVDGATAGTANISYTEAISATIIYHVTETWARDANANGELPLGFDIGAGLPLLVSN